MIISDEEFLDILKSHIILYKDGSVAIAEISENASEKKFTQYLRQHARLATQDDKQKNGNILKNNNYCFSQVM